MKKILIIDDDKLFVDLLELELKQFRVIKAYTIEQAFDKLNNAEFDLIILDLLLPGYSGIGLLNEIVASDLLNIIPIVICSSVAEKVSMEQFAGANVKAILDKTTMKPNDVYFTAKAFLDD